ncbi:hypothetical protein NUZ5A_20242 [Candidatus Nitrosotenuis uzonensis]|uniref:Polysaccharide pyruvyl transferase domain-containing protein n=2 Tax=Candidatus Nitrosotenuis uzonensis TaxID=1407055 RepID=A0A812ETT7_9ARCH|nr:hypothetical protein NUZ5A_20242 [Candidatus Nitrosotenuis uzonensis]
MVVGFQKVSKTSTIIMSHEQDALMKIIELGGKVVEGVQVGRGNAGDTAVGDAFSYLFQKEFPNSKVQFMQSRKIFTKQDVDEINKADVLFLAGGGLFLYDTFRNDVSDWQWGISPELIEMIKIPIVVYALGYNKFRGQREFKKCFNDTINKLVEKSVFFSLRNSGSIRSIRRHIDFQLRDKVQLNFCPTLLLREKFQFHKSKTKSVAFVLGGDRIMNRHKNLETFVQHIQTFVDYLKKQGYETILINHLHDYWIARYVKFDRFIELFDRPSEYIYEVYSEIDTVISDRGHGQMVPFSCGCKILSPVSHDKLNWFLEDIELEEFGIEESDEELSNKLISKFNKLHEIDWPQIHAAKMAKISKTNHDNMIMLKSKLRKTISL